MIQSKQKLIDDLWTQLVANSEESLIHLIFGSDDVSHDTLDMSIRQMRDVAIGLADSMERVQDEIRNS